MVGDLRPVIAIVMLVAAVIVLKAGFRRLRRATRRRLSAKRIGQKLRNLRRLSKRRMRLWHEWVTGGLPGQMVATLLVVDGDTLDDPATGARYRLANIDCPETDDRAGCYREKVKGEEAKSAAEMIIATASKIELRPTGRVDVYGRTIAHVRIDDRDFGKLMIARGYARRWNGKREEWCGPKGGLAILAKATGTEHTCKTCRVGMIANRKAANTVVAFPTKRHKSGTVGQNEP